MVMRVVLLVVRVDWVVSVVVGVECVVFDGLVMVVFKW